MLRGGFVDNMDNMNSKSVRRRVAIMRNEPSEAAPELAEALRILYDLQNGPPLEKYRDQWNDAMALAKAALAKAGSL
jgi:hypothetical protein